MRGEIWRKIRLVGTVLVAVVALPSLSSCGERFDAPCHVVELRVVLDEHMTAGRSGPLGLSEGDAGEVIIAWPSTASGMSLVVARSDGMARISRTFPAPAALRSRSRSSSDRSGANVDVGATFTGSGMLFHWTETTSTKNDDGSITFSAALRLQHAGLHGNEGHLVSDPDLACTDCLLATAFVSTGTTTVAIVHEAPASGAATSAATRSRLVSFTPDGRKLASVDVSVLADAQDGPLPGPPPGVGGPVPARPPVSMALSVRGGFFVARIGATVAVFDVALARRASPYALPTSAAVFDVDGSSGDLDLAWVSVTAIGDDGAPAFVGDAPDLLFERRGPSGAPRISSHRIASASGALAVRRNHDRTGVLHAAAGREWFTLVDDSGKKIGGEHPLAARETAAGDGPGGPGSFATSAPASTRLLIPGDRTRFAVWSAERRVVREEIVCDP